MSKKDSLRAAQATSRILPKRDVAAPTKNVFTSEEEENAEVIPTAAIEEPKTPETASLPSEKVADSKPSPQKNVSGEPKAKDNTEKKNTDQNSQSYTQRALADGGKITSLYLADKLVKAAKRKAAMSNVSFQEYISTLIDQEALEFDTKDVDQLYDDVSESVYGKKVNVSVYLTGENLAFFDKARSKAGIIRNQYINYIINKAVL